MKKPFLALFLAFVALAPCLASPVSTVSVPATRSNGDTITATIWNNDVGSIYTYINSVLAPALNVLTTQGDLYVYNGSALARLGLGTNNQVLTADSAQALGVKWATFANSAPLSTKGDLLTTNGSASQRLGVGSDGQVLTADSAQTLGIKWAAASASAIPTGSVVAWSPTYAGTNTIPAGWLLCDGSSGTPNLIGMFIIGARPSGSASTANASGYGLKTVDAVATGTATHTHTIPLQTGTTGNPNGGNTTASGSGVGVTAKTHTHTFQYGNFSSSATSTEPADYALVYLMKS